MKNKKRKKKIIICLIISVCILILLLVTLAKQLKTASTNSTDEVVVIRGLENKYPTGTVAFSKEYSGAFTMNEISTKVSVFLTSTVPTLRNLSLKYDEEKIVDYYNNNFGTVKELCGEITKTQFVELTNLVRKMNTKELKYVSSEYMTDTIQKSDNLFKINLKISYENEDPIIVTINVSDLQKTIKLTCAE